MTIDALGDSERALLYFGAADPKDRPPLVFPPELPVGVTEVFGEFVGRTLGLRGIGVKELVGDTEREKRTGINRDST